MAEIKRLPDRDIPIDQYIEWKIHILTNHFFIRLNSEDYDHFLNCNTEIAVDNYAKKLIKERL